MRLPMGSCRSDARARSSTKTRPTVDALPYSREPTPFVGGHALFRPTARPHSSRPAHLVASEVLAASYYTDKVSVVVGASSGIGRAVAERLARDGAHVLAVGRSATALGELEAELREAGVRIETAAADVRDEEAMNGIIAGVVQQHGRIDLLYNGAGFGLLGFCEETSLRDWERMFAVCVKGVVHGIHAAYPVMCEQGFGQIVNVASLAGLIPLPASTAYVGAKHAVVGLSQSLRLEARRHGVSVSVVCPAAVETPIFDESRSRYVNFDAEKIMAARPGGVLTADACAKKILAGVRRNRAIITPGPARILWLMHRFFPALTQWMMNRMVRSLEEAHSPPEAPGRLSRTKAGGE